MNIKRKSELLREYYTDRWGYETTGREVTVVVGECNDGLNLTFDVWGFGQEERLIERANGTLFHLNDYDPYPTYLFLADSTEPADLAKHWLSHMTPYDLSKFYVHEVNDAFECQHTILEIIPLVDDPVFCSLKCQDVESQQIYYIHFDDGDLRLSLSSDWTLLEPEDESLSTRHFDRLPHANEVGTLLSI